MAGKRCATVGCPGQPTHRLTYTTPEDREEPVTELVCSPCGLGYVRRPALKATMELIKAPGRKRCKLFIWEGVLTDYSSGMVVALAPDLASALELVRTQVSEYGYMEVCSTTPTVIESLTTVPQEWHVTGGS